MTRFASKSSSKVSPHNVFHLCAAVLLLITGAIKLISALGSARELDLANPMLVFTNRSILLGGGLLELWISGYLLCGSNQFLKTLLTAWLATAFVAYRYAMWLGGIVTSCGCLGRNFGWAPFIEKNETMLTRVILAYLLVGGYSLLFCEFQRTVTRDEVVK